MSRNPLNLIARLYAGALTGLLLSLGLSRIVWLEMRVKTGLLIPLCAVAFVLFGGMSLRLVTRRRLLVLQFMLVFLFLMAGGWDPSSLDILPSALVRDGLGLSGMPLASLNWWLLTGVVLGNAALAGLRPGQETS